jgi:hypothetical protein
MFLWIVTSCIDVVGYERFGGICCLHIQGEVTGSCNGIQIQDRE